MFVVITALIVLIASIGIMLGSIIMNQIYPSHSSALAVAVYNGLGFILAVLGLGISVVGYQKNKDMKLAKRTMMLGLGCAFILLLLFPLSELGYLSKVR